MRLVRPPGWLVALGLVLVLAFGVSAANAQTSSRSVAWQRYDVDLSLQTDGSLAVVETQTVAFQGTYQQGSRSIPLARTSGISDVSVSSLSVSAAQTLLQFT